MGTTGILSVDLTGRQGCLPAPQAGSRCHLVHPSDLFNRATATLGNCLCGFNRINQPEAIGDRVAETKSIHEFASEPAVPRCEGRNKGALKDITVISPAITSKVAVDSKGD